MIRYCIEHPKAANILMLILFAVGLAIAPTIKKETFPLIERYEVQISVPFPGASASDTEESICQRLEDATDSISFVDEQRCEAKDNIGLMTIKMLESGNWRTFIDDVNRAVEGIDDFPDNTERPVVKELGRTNPVISIALTASIPKPQLKALAEQYKAKLLQIPDISIVDIEGFSQHQLNISISDSNLRQYGLSLNDIAKRIGSQAIDLPSGDVKTSSTDYQIRFTDLRRTAHQLSSLIVIKGDNSSEIQLGDIATIQDTFEIDEDKIDFNGQSAAILKISKNKAEDSLNIFQAVTEFVNSEKQLLPKGMNLSLTEDSASIVQDRIQMLLKNSWQGLLLVTCALLLFFNSRYTLWVVMGLPVSFLGSMLAFHFFGVSINMISMVALLIAIGILMDDAIVISESISAEYQKGHSPTDAALLGTQKVMRGVLSSFITTILVFSSLIFLQGDLGQVLKVIPIVLISVLAVSLIEAFLILPHHLKTALAQTHDHPDAHWRARFQIKFEQLCTYVGQLADLSVKYRYAVVGLAMALLFISISMIASGILKFRAFPELDGDVLNARIILPQGTPLKKTEQIMDHLLLALEKTNKRLSQTETEKLVRNVSVYYNKNEDAFESGPHIATMTLDVLPAEYRQHSLAELTHAWRTEVGDMADVISIQYKQPNFGPAGRPIHLRIQGHDLADMAKASQMTQDWLRGYSGVFDIIDDLRPGKPQIRIRLIEGVLASGLDAETVANQLRAAYQGITIDTIQYQGEDYEVYLQLDEKAKDTLADFDYFPIIHPQTNQVIPLAAVTKIDTEREFGRIFRVNGQRTVSIFGDINAELANTQEVLKDVQKNFLPKFKATYPHLSLQFEGELKNSAQTGGSIKVGFMLGALGIFLLLSWQFRSYLEPIVVMITIPLAFIGVIWGHMMMGLDFTMPSMMGFVSLAGIVVNDSILLVEFIKYRVKEGLPLHNAASAATRDRFRAIFLTSFTTIAGVLPLLFETSLQAQVLVPLVTSIAFGLMASTFLILFVLPALYVILGDFGFVEKPC